MTDDKKEQQEEYSIFPLKKKDESKEPDVVENGSEDIDSVRARNKSLYADKIRSKNERSILSQQIEGRDEALDHVEAYGDKKVRKLAKRHGIIFESDLEGALTRKILFKLTNYAIVVGVILLFVFSGSNPAIKAAITNITKSPIELLGIFAFFALDLYLFFRWYRRA